MIYRIQDAGIDQGGLLKDLLEEILQRGFDLNMGFMRATANNQLYPAPSALAIEHGPEILELLGLVVGKALYEGILLSAELTPLCIIALLHRQATLEDLASLDPILYQSLLQVCLHLRRHAASHILLIEHAALIFRFSCVLACVSMWHQSSPQVMTGMLAFTHRIP
jgi:hypothetical protein